MHPLLIKLCSNYIADNKNNFYQKRVCLKNTCETKCETDFGFFRSNEMIFFWMKIQELKYTVSSEIIMQIRIVGSPSDVKRSDSIGIPI